MTTDERPCGCGYRPEDIKAITELIQRSRAEGRRAAAQAIRAADTSGWPGGRGSDVDECQELAARLAEGEELTTP